MRRFGPPVTALILALLVLNSGDVLHRWWDSFGPAIEWYGVTVETPRVKPGETLNATYSGIVHKQCPSDIRGFLVAADGSVPVRYPTVSGGYTKPTGGPSNIKVSVGIPLAADNGLARLKSGPYVYRTLVTRYCPSGVEYDNAVPDVEFFLEVPG